VYAETSKEGIGMPKLDVNAIPKSPDLFPKMGKEPIELELKRTAFQRESLNPDGSFTSEVFSHPIHWKNRHGQWVSIDNTIVPSTEDLSFPLKNASNDVQVRFVENFIDQAINRVEYKDHFVEFIPQHALPSLGLPKGNQITYPSIYTFVDLKYTVLSTGVKEDIILHNSSAQNTFTFELKTKGVTPKANQDGTISYIDADNNEVFISGEPFAIDGNEVYTDKVTSKLRQVEDQWFVDITLDAAWLQDENVSFLL
jgi:hypothetical protein